VFRSSILAAIVLVAFGCARKETATTTQAPPPSAPAAKDVAIAASGEGEFCDLTFTITNDEKTAAGRRLVATSTIGGRTVAFAVQLGKDWPGSKTGEGIEMAIRSGEVRLVRIGAESDSFVQVLDKSYGAKVGATKMKPETRFEGISLEGNPANLEDGPARIKLFHDINDGPNYAELYLNIDMKQKSLELAEKDQEYRPMIVRALAQK
jgi:hypothetical protein